ncbi:MAG: GTP-sensing pleiotropic transcriptional regulator CodY, partial [Firmicutes bacterium]|nr:GTP-sensing pleiotropic transcriptional regulator CodY [Bacillota bacterium]
METMLGKVRKLNWVLQEAPKGDFSFKDLCAILSKLLDSNVYVLDTECTLLGADLRNVEDASIFTDPETGMETLPREYAESLAEVNETLVNLQNEQVLEILKYEEKTRSKFHTIIPIVGGGQRWGTMLLARYNPEFS